MGDFQICVSVPLSYFVKQLAYLPRSLAINGISAKKLWQFTRAKYEFGE